MEVEEGPEKRLLRDLFRQAQITDLGVGVADRHVLEPVDYGREGFYAALLSGLYERLKRLQRGMPLARVLPELDGVALGVGDGRYD